MIEKWGAECEENTRRWKEAHAADPCERCGMTAGVEIMGIIYMATFFS